MSCLSLLPFQSYLPLLQSTRLSPSPTRLSVRCRCRPLPLPDSDEDDPDLSLPRPRPSHFHVLGLGQAMVDFSGMVEESFVERLGVGVQKGGRKEVTHQERGRVLRAMDGRSYKAAAGGSLSNTLVALSRLSRSTLDVGMAATVGPDPLGAFFRSKLGRARVHLVSEAVPEATTGTVIVLTTPDAQRTMLSFQGTSPPLRFDPSLAALVSNARVLVVEGYLFGLPGALHTIHHACRSSSSSSLVALTASDVSCVHAHFHHFWDVLSKYADMVFANSEEARALCGFTSEESAEMAARYLSERVGVVSVTDGAKGSYIGVKGEAIYIPAWPCAAVDTCGAGDAYAAGLLYGILKGRDHYDIAEVGMLASRVAATVVAQQGTRLSVQHAADLAHSYQPSSSDHISSF